VVPNVKAYGGRMDTVYKKMPFNQQHEEIILITGGQACFIHKKKHGGKIFHTAGIK